MVLGGLVSEAEGLISEPFEHLLTFKTPLGARDTHFSY